MLELLEERLLELFERLPLALARPLEDRLCALALPPLLAAWALLDLPEDEEDLEEEEELRDAIALLLWIDWKGPRDCCGRSINLGTLPAPSVGFAIA